MSKIFYLRCKKHNENKNSNISRAKYCKIMTFTYSYDGNRKKNKFIKKWDPKGLKNFLSKVPKLTGFPFWFF